MFDSAYRFARRFRSFAALAGLWAAVAAAGCGRPYEVATPEGFVELTDGDARVYDSNASEYRASTADGVVLGIRAWKNEPKVDLAVAVRAIENRTRLGEGYALVEKKDVTARNGVKGQELRFGHDENGAAHLYSVAVFVTDDHVYLVESGGKTDLVDKARASIDWFVKSFQPE